MRPLSFHAGVVTAAVVLDQWIKHLVETGLDMHVRVDVAPMLALYRTHNTGIAFSMLADLGSAGLVVLTLGVIGFVSWIAVRTEPSQRMARLGFALVIGGAIGNLIDRVRLGYVVDYVLFHLPDWSFAIFNLADAFITVGACMVALDEILSWLKARRRGADGPDR